MEKPGVIDEEHHRRGFSPCLRRVAQLEAPPLEAGRRMRQEGFTKHTVELVGRHLDPALTDHLQRRRNEGADPLFRARGERDDRRERGELEVLGEHGAPVGRLSLSLRNQVDLVDHDDEALAGLQGVAGDVLVLRQHPGRGVDDEEDGVRALHRMDAAHQAVAFDLVAVGRLAPNACGVDQDDGDSVVDELGVDGVARCARHRADQGPLVAEQGVEQRRLADVRPAHDREPVGLLVGGRFEIGRRQRFEHAVEEVPHPDAVLGRKEGRLGKAQLEDLVGEVALARRVRLVRGDDDLPPGAAKQLRDLAIDRGQPLADVEQQDDHLRLVDRDAGLGLDGPLGRILGTVQVEAGSVHHGEFAPAPVGDAVKPVARQAGLRIHDGLAPAEDAVEQGRLADVRPADDGNDGARHDVN